MYIFIKSGAGVNLIIMNKSSKIYVAGHTGLLGTALLKKLKENGFNNIITISYQDLDLTNNLKVDTFFKQNKPEYIFLAAGITGGIIANKTYPAKFLHINISIQDNLFQAAQAHKVKHLVFYGSSCVYPKNSPQPIKEAYLLTGEIEETSEAYAAAKIAGIMGCKAYNNEFKTDRFIALIPNSMYGYNDNFDKNSSHVIAALITKIHEAKIKNKKELFLWGSGAPKREFLFSEDVADASLFVMANSKKLRNRHYNIGTGFDYSIKELAYIIKSIVKYEGEIFWDTSKPDGTLRKLLDSSELNKLGWKPSVTLETGLRLTYDWYLGNIERLIYEK